MIPYPSFVLAAGIGLVATVTSARAEWPARVFAPYMYLGAGDNFKITDCADACGQKHYTLAFIIADKEGQPAWDGRFPLEQNLYADQIQAIRQRGGDVIVSFGGEAGKELALVEPDITALEAKYQSVIDRYKFTWLDFDIEGKAIENEEANHRRNTVLVALQKKNPGLIISYTLSVDPTGLSRHARGLLTDAKAQGVLVHSANVMTMDYGARFSDGKKMSEVSIASAEKAHEQCQAIDSRIQIGLTSMIGQNDVKTEVFTLEDAQAFETWAVAQPWVCSVSFWSSNRDAGVPGRKQGNTGSGIPQSPWAFTKTFQAFAASKQP